MKIGFIVNHVKKEDPNFTTTGLALCAHKRGHEVFYMGAGDLVYYSDEQVGAHACQVPGKKFSSSTAFMQAVKDAPRETITYAGRDAMKHRKYPAEDNKK